MTGSEALAVVRWNDGVIVDAGVVVDTATGIRIGPPNPGDPPVPAQLLALGCAFVPQTSRTRWSLLIAAIDSRSLEPLRALRLGFRRRHPADSMPAVAVAVAMAARLPALVMTTLFLVPALVVGVMVDGIDAAFSVAVIAAATGVGSLISHEVAHLTVLRSATGCGSAGAVAHSWANVWIVSPPLPRLARRLSACAGPAAGITTCAVSAGIGSPSWVCIGIGVVHLSNLLPSAPDGRLLFA